MSRGAMTGRAETGTEMWVSRSGNPRRKLAHTWELARAAGGRFGINTGHANAVVEEAIARDGIPELAGYPARRREVRYGQGSRVDLLLTGAGRPDCYVEVKNVHLMREAGAAEFPDCVTARGTRHLRELAGVAAAGDRQSTRLNSSQ